MLTKVQLKAAEHKSRSTEIGTSEETAFLQKTSLPCKKKQFFVKFSEDHLLHINQKFPLLLRQHSFKAMK